MGSKMSLPPGGNSYCGGTGGGATTGGDNGSAAEIGRQQLILLQRDRFERGQGLVVADGLGQVADEWLVGLLPPQILG